VSTYGLQYLFAAKLRFPCSVWILSKSGIGLYCIFFFSICDCIRCDHSFSLDNYNSVITIGV